MPKPWREALRDTYPNLPLNDVKPSDALTWAEKEIADLRAAIAQQSAYGTPVTNSHASNAGEDTERLDWLEESGHAYTNYDGQWKFSDIPFGAGAASLREAIDTDRAKEKK
jgi:hypothetical protein